MVVVCEKCETRFHLGDSKIPAEGTRVRCSRCKNEFFIAPPGSGDADVIEEVLAEVSGAGGTPLAEPQRHGSKGPAEPQAEEHSSGDFEEDWQFNDDSHPHIQMDAESELSDFGEFDSSGMDLSGEDPLLGGAPPSAEASPSGQAPPTAEASLPEIAREAADPFGEPKPQGLPAADPPIDPVESIRARDAGLDFSSPDDLGSLEDWDFVGTGDAEPALDPTPAEEGAALSTADASGSASPLAELEEPLAAGPQHAEDSDPPALVARFAGAASVLGWLVVVVAFSLGLSASFTRSGQGSTVQPTAGKIAVSGLPITASEVKGRLVENALAGNLLVVSGKLENTGSVAVTPGHPVLVQLVSASGAPITDATAAAGRPVGETRIREWDPDRLRLDLERSAAEMALRSLRPGARIPFDAVFESIPESAAGWVLQTATSASHPAPASPLLPTARPAWE